MNKQLAKSLSDGDIRKVLGAKTRIITYPQLKNYNTIDQLLEVDNRCVILVETKVNSGHWVCVLKYGNTCEFWDSYGLPQIDSELHYVSLQERKSLGEMKPLLSALLDECPYQVVYNKTDLQSWKPNVNTCGRWVCLRLQHADMTLPQFLKYVKSFHAPNTDELVCQLVKI